MTESFCQDPLENWFGRQSRKVNPSTVEFGCTNNAIRNQKHFKPIANGNAADSGMISLTDVTLPYWKPKKEWKFKCRSWIKKLLLLPKYNKTQVNSLLNVSMLFLFLSL